LTEDSLFSRSEPKLAGGRHQEILLRLLLLLLLLATELKQAGALLRRQGDR